MNTNLANMWVSIENRFASGAYFDWREDLADKLEILNPYLLPTKKQAISYSCPYPGLEGCPREIINYKGEIMAICCNYESPGECDTVNLTQKDIIIYEIDWIKLTKELASIFGFEYNYSKLENFIDTHLVGELLVEYKRFAVYIAVSHPAERFEQIIFKLTEQHQDNPFIMIFLTFEYVAQEILVNLRAKGCLTICLSDLVVADDNGELKLKYNPEKNI